MWLWRQRCVGVQCVMVFGADVGGDGDRPNLPPCSFSRPGSHSPLLPRLRAASPPGPHLCCPTHPTSMVPLLHIQPVLSASTTWPPCPAPAPRVHPTLHPRDKLGPSQPALSLMLGQPRAVATPGSRLAAAWGSGQIPKQGLTVVQEQALGVGCESWGIPANSGKANAYDTLPAVPSPSGTHTLHSP